MRLLTATLPGQHFVAIEPQPPAYVVRTSSQGGAAPGDIPLRLKGQQRQVASFFLSMSLRPDRSGKYLAVAQSRFWLRDLDRRPLVRLEFLDSARKAPSCHWQFHGESLPFQRLLNEARPDSKAARSLSNLHFPVGGARMRPGVEDFVQFLIQECGFDSVPSWRREVERSRARWRLVQTKTLVREAPIAAAKGLAEHLGVKVLRLARLSKSDDAIDGSFGRW